MKNKMKMLLVGLLAVSSVQAQLLEIWKDQRVVNFNLKTQVDSITYKSDSLILWHGGGSTGYAAYGFTDDIDSVVFKKTEELGNVQVCIYESLAKTLSCKEKIYKTVVINGQIWMAENLDFGEFLFDLEQSEGGWGQYQNKMQKFCYGNNQLNCDTNGGLYQWHTAMAFENSCVNNSCQRQINSGNHKGVCPIGWHIPKKEDWDLLQEYLGGEAMAAKKMKLNTTGNFYWDGSVNNDGNSSGFSTLPSGNRYASGGFSWFGEYAYYWEATQDVDDYSYFRQLGKFSTSLDRNANYKSSAFSVRCLKD